MNKFMIKTTILSLSAALVLGIGGCSSNSNNDSTGGGTTTAVSYGGTGIDGILVGSTVCIDVNQNASCDGDEPTDPDGTDAQGKFEIPETTLTGPLLLIGGTDIGTGLPFTGSLTAPAGSTVVTPLTSAVQSLVKSGKTPQEAEANIKAALGLTNVDVNLTTFDPFAEVSANAQAVLASQAHLQTIVHAASVAVASADANKSTGDVMGDVFAQISQSFDGATSDVNLTVSDVTAVTKSVANDLYADNQVALVSVKNNAEATAQSAVDAAEATQATIESGTPEEAEAGLNAGITLVNTSIAADINSSTAASVSAADDLNATALQAIVDAQQLQEEREAEIAQAVQDALDAQQALRDAEIAAANASAEEAKAAYDALLEAQAEQLRQAEAQRAAEAAAAEAAALAAAQEAQLAVNQAAAEAIAAAELKAVQDKAIAEKAEADARIAAAEEAARVAKAIDDLATAQLAAVNAERNAAVNIMKIQAEALVASAYSYIPQVEEAKDSIVFIQSLDSNYSSDSVIVNALSDVNSALTDVATLSDDTNTSAQNLYSFALLVSAESNVTDANVTDANITLQVVIDKEALAKAQVAVGQTALDTTRTRVLVLRAAIAEAQAQAAADAEKDRVIALIQTALTTAEDNNVSSDLASIDTAVSLAELDLNATRLIASEYTTLAIDISSAEVAYSDMLGLQTNAHQDATDVNDSIQVIIEELAQAQDANVTELLAQEKSFQAIHSAAELSLKAGEVAGIRTTLANALIDAQTLRQTELDRLNGEAVTAAILLSQGEAQASKTAADNNISAVAGMAVQAALDAQAIANITTVDVNAEALAATIAATAVQTAYTTALEAQISVDSNVTAVLSATTAEAAAIAASNAAAGALVVATQTAIVVQQAGIASTQLVAAQAKADAVGSETNTTVTIADNVWEDGKTLYSFNFELDNGEVSLGYDDIELSSGQLVFASYGYDFNNSTWIPRTDNEDASLQADGSWGVETAASYVIDETNSSIMTVNANEQIALLSAVSIAGQTVNFNVSGSDITLPVTFSTGSVSYTLAFKQLVDSYSFDSWIPRDYETGATFTTLENFMLRDGNFYWDDASQVGIQAQRNSDYSAFLDQSGTAVTTLTLGQKGNLVSWNSDHSVSTVTGEWEVVNLPNQTVLTVKGTLDANTTNYDAYMEYGQQFVTLYDGEVRKVELRLASTEFITEDDILGNAQAKADILNAIADFEFPNPLALLLGGQTLWSQAGGEPNTLAKQIFNGDATVVNWVEVEFPGETLCDGNLSVSYEDNGTITATVVNDSCMDTPIGTSFNFSVEVNDSWNYILVDSNRWYFDEQDARNEFLSTATVSFDLDSYIRGNTLYYVEQIDQNYLGQAALYNFETNGSTTGEDAGGYYDDGVIYTVIENNVTRSDGIVFSHFASTPDGKGEMFEVYTNGVYLGELVLYASEVDRNAALTVASNNPPLVQSDIFLTMLVGESLSGIVNASDADGDSLTFTASSLSGFASAELNATTGAFTLVAGDVGQAQVIVNVSDGISSDEVIVNVNIITGNTSSSDELAYSETTETLTLANFDAVVTTQAIPGDTPLHTFWGLNNGILEHDIMEFNTTTFRLDFADSNETLYYTNTLSTGEVNVSVDGTSYDAANQVVSMKLLEIETNTTVLSNELNITMTDGSVAYKAAIMMTKDEFDFWGEAKDYSTGVQGGVAYTSLTSLIESGMATQDQNNWSRALVFDKDQAGNLVEVDFSGYFQTGNPDDIYVINPNAGSWETNATQINDSVTAYVLYVYAADTQRFENKIYVLDDFGVDGNASSATNTVWEGEYRAAGNIEIEYQYNDIAAQAIIDDYKASTISVEYGFGEEWLSNKTLYWVFSGDANESAAIITMDFGSNIAMLDFDSNITMLWSGEDVDGPWSGDIPYYLDNNGSIVAQPDAPEDTSIVDKFTIDSISEDRFRVQHIDMADSSVIASDYIFYNIADAEAYLESIIQ